MKKRLSNGRNSSSKTRPEDDEIITQKVKFASLYEDDEAVAEEDEDEEEEEESGALRQKLKKIWKISSIKNGVNNQQQQQQQQKQQEKFVCSKCGKGFQSLKAKCGHMACHSHKEKTTITNLISKQKPAMDDSQSDTESSVARRLTRRSRRPQYRNKNHISVSKVGSKAKVDVYKNCSSDDSEVEQEQKEVAISLMMLSMDSANWGRLKSVADSSDNNSIVLEAQRNCFSNGYRVDEASKKCGSKKVMSLGDSKSLKVRDLLRKSNVDEGSKTEPHLSLKKLKRAFDAGLIRHGEGCNKTKRPKIDSCLAKRALNACAESHKNFTVTAAAPPYKSDEVSAAFERNGTQFHDLIDLNLPAPMEDDEASL